MILFWHLQALVQRAPPRKHSQYFFRQRDFLQWHPFTCCVPCATCRASSAQLSVAHACMWPAIARQKGDTLWAFQVSPVHESCHAV